MARCPGRWFASLALLVLLVGACTSQSSSDDGTAAGGADGTDDTDPTGDNGTASDAQGVTDDTITLSLIAADLSLLSEQNLAPELGDPVAAAQATVDEINENGGVAGRQLELETHVIENLEIINRDVARARCIAATEEDKPFAVVLTAAIPGEVARCVAAEHPVLTMSMQSWDRALYDDAQGRLFACCTNTSTGRERQYASWPRLVDQETPLAEHTVGIVRMDILEQQIGVDDGLKPALDDMGIEVAAEAVIPCPEGGTSTCAQHDVAIQRMKDAGVDVVFTSVFAQAGVALVEAAEAVDYRPQWATIGDNTTDTVGKFFAPVYDSWNGTLGVSHVFEEISPESEACNANVAERTGVSQERGSDAFGFTGLTCLQIQVLAQAIDAVDGALTHEAVIAALEAIDDVPTVHGPRGSFGPEKHDSGDYVFLSRWDSAAETWAAVDSTPYKAE